METKPWGDPNKAKVLVIGHDPRLQKSNTQAEYCFFADYYFNPYPSRKSDQQKYRLASAIFSYIMWLTSNKYKEDEFIITNLCNHHLQKAPENKTVYIPENKSREGLKNIKELIKSSNIDLILATSQQVNYWLQKLDFYQSTENYLRNSEPNSAGVKKNYYEPTGRSPFLEICGKKFLAEGIPLFPVLHVKQYPLKGYIKKNYEKLLIDCINEIKKL